MAKKVEANAEVATPVVKYSKAQLLKTVRYSAYRDLLWALLNDGVEYTHDDVEGIIEKFLKAEVK
jgi:hypothetical protein